METKSNLYKSKFLYGFFFSLTISSLGIVQKYLGVLGVFAYLTIVILLFIFFGYKIMSTFLRVFTEKQAFFLCLATLLCLVIIFFYVYPLVNSNMPGKGSDRDEDNNMATVELLNGRYPYYVKTYLGNPITHFPGALLLSIPFVLIGNAAYQNFFWLLIFLVISYFYLNSWRFSLFLFWLIIFLSPEFMHELITGGDLISNVVYVLASVFFLVGSVSRMPISLPKGVFFAVLLGISLSSRMTFVFVLPLLFSCILQNTKWQVAVKYLSLTGISLLAITLPFYLYDPKHFSPLYGQLYKISRFESFFPLVTIMLLVALALVSISLSFMRMQNDCVVLFRNCAIVQALFVLSCVIFDTLQNRGLMFISSGYGLSFLFFGALASLHELKRNYFDRY